MKGKLILLLLACLAVSSYAQTRCWYDYSSMKRGFLTDCVDGCKDYPTLDAAAEACDKNTLCEGVSNEFKANGGSNSIGPSANVGWQLRRGSISSTQNKYNQQGYTFLKGTKFCNINSVMYGGPIFDYAIKKDCVDSKCTSYTNWLSAAQQLQSLNADAAVTVLDNGNWAPYKTQSLSASDYAVSFFIPKTLNTEYTSDKNQYYDEKREYSLDGCVNKCKDYASLKEAQYYCTKSAECIGITYQHVNIDSGDNSTGYLLGYGYQLRKGTLKAKSGVLTWIKQSGFVNNPPTSGTTTSTATSTGTSEDGSKTSSTTTTTTSTTITSSSSSTSTSSSSNTTGATTTGTNTNGATSTGATSGTVTNNTSSTSPVTTVEPIAPVTTTAPTTTTTAPTTTTTAPTTTTTAPTTTTTAPTTTTTAPTTTTTAPTTTTTTTTTTTASTSGSIGVKKEELCPVLYRDCYYKGEFISICNSDPDFDWHIYKSMTIPSGKVVKIFELDNYKGESYIYDQNVPCSDDLELFLFTHKKLSINGVTIKEKKEHHNKKHHKKHHNKLKKNSL